MIQTIYKNVQTKISKYLKMSIKNSNILEFEIINIYMVVKIIEIVVYLKY